MPAPKTIYYPDYVASIFGRGMALNLAISSRGYTADVAENVPSLDVSGGHDAKAGVLIFCAVTQDLSQRTLRPPAPTTPSPNLCPMPPPASVARAPRP